VKEANEWQRGLGNANVGVVGKVNGRAKRLC